MIADGLYYAVHLYGRKAYDSAQEKACTCIPVQGTTTSSERIKPKRNEIDVTQSKSIFRNIYDNFSEIFKKFIDLLTESALIQSALSIVKPSINFFKKLCESLFKCNPLKSDAGSIDFVIFFKKCIKNMHTTLFK